MPKPIWSVHKKSSAQRRKETVPRSVIPFFFCLNSKRYSSIAFTQLGFLHPIPCVARHLAINLKTLSPSLPWRVAGLSGSSRAGSKDALVQFGEKI